MIRSIGIKRPEGKFDITYFQEDEKAPTITTHFTIDCACGDFSGNWIKSFNPDLEEQSRIYSPQGPSVRPDHTFHLKASILEDHLKERYDKEPLEIGCRSCKHTFSFTRESYDSLIKQIHQVNQIRETEYFI